MCEELIRLAAIAKALKNYFKQIDLILLIFALIATACGV